jgi:hypothetical protein
VTDPWDRGFSIDSLANACIFVETVWNEERVPPSRLHGRGPQPRDLSGAPKWSGQFSQYIFANPSEVQEVTTTERGVHDTRHFYRYPLWRALSLLERRDHDRWTKGVPRRPFHPTPVSVLRAMAKDDFRPDRVRLRYADGTRIPADMVELFCIGAARKLRGTYQEEFVEWVDKSASQQDAETAA